MKLKKTLALCLAVAMSVTALTACGNTESTKESESAKTETKVEDQNKESSTDEVKEPHTYTGMGMVYDEERQPYTSNTWQYYFDMTGLDIEVVTELPMSEAAEKGNLIMSSGDYPEFLIKMASIDLNTYGMDGLLIPLEDLIRENMPNLSAILDERNAWDALRTYDGHIYALPGIQRPAFEGWGTSGMFINQNWIEKLGLETPTSMEELYTVFKAFKEQDPNGNGIADEIPWAPTNTNSLLIYQGGASYYADKYVAVKDGEFIFYPYDDLYREWLEWSAKFYEEGLIYENCFTMTSEEQRALGKSVDIDVLGAVTSNRCFVFVADAYFDDYVSLKTFDPDNTAMGNGLEPGSFAITDKCEDPATLLAAIDVWYTPEAGYVARYGLEGDRWFYNSDGLIETIPETDDTKLSYRLVGAASVPSDYQSPLADVVVFENDADKREAESYTEGHAYSGGVILPTLVTSKEEADTLTTIKTDISAYINTFTQEVIIGSKELNDTTWEEFKATLSQMGADEYFEIYKAAYEKATK